MTACCLCWGVMRCRPTSIGPENTCDASSLNSINPVLWLELAGMHLASGHCIISPPYSLVELYREEVQSIWGLRSTWCVYPNSKRKTTWFFRVSPIQWGTRSTVCSVCSSDNHMARHPKHQDTIRLCTGRGSHGYCINSVRLAFVELLIKHEVDDGAYFKAALSKFWPQTKVLSWLSLVVHPTDTEQHYHPNGHLKNTGSIFTDL